ncbi:MAG: hypothetical protein ACI8VT_003156 [Saprospiraceae bacterium]|jgi:hypothetical protein
MRVILCLFFTCLYTSIAICQDLFLSPIVKKFCQPGVIHKSPTKGLLLEYEINPTVRLRNSTGISGSPETGFNKRLNMKLKAPIIIRKDLKVIAGWNYYSEEYNFDRLETDNFRLLSNIDDKHLKSSRLTLSVIKPINRKYYLALKGQASFNGDYSGMFNFDRKYANYKLLSVFGVQSSPSLEWGIGVLYSFGNRMPVIPIIMYNHTFNPRWGIEAVLPAKIKLRYNLNDRNIFLFGPELDSRQYYVDNHADKAYTMRRRDLKLALSYQRHLGSFFWTEISGGYTHNFSTKFETNQSGEIQDTYDYNSSGSPFLKVGIFISPSKVLGKKRNRRK